ncbi:outer membrane receptor protein involved in Fe transport [Christiangramia gaetbulicola]|uniref:Outer membrane receptor protein involved in Fe transport n=1 Tax=Christiangramia gaetbulicola TaxID=703340 RepID=A0A2T6ACX6_9FLAO|nr:outer membrane beta-barrel protein [Christiangramia gaetbulicola]PTX41674.1 outer membrane receptor protein involved in Fe transport [Christiangramia gaetbulicola]
MRFYLSLLGMLISGLTFSQEFQITGKVVDDSSNPLESATIYTEKPTDSSLVSYTISEKDGSFLLQGVTKSPKLNLIISYNGYAPHQQVLTVEKNMTLEDIRLKIADNSLDEITLTATRAPITIKKDTLEFNAGSFNTRQDANLEDLMKKLPGVEVDSDGNITVNGKPVSRILVNGKEFFGDDPKIATKNLPKEIIDKVQVTDTKTKSEEFTGKAGDPDNKTINIELKEDKNKGYFSRVTAGGGTDDRYELSGIGNYFKDDLRVSVLASSNNINSSGFSFDEVFDMMGGNARSVRFNSNGSFSINGNGFGSSGGITKSETAGFNFVNEWDNDMELSADYFYGKNDTETRTRVERENILPDSRYFVNSESSSNLVNDSHRANLRYEVEFDTLTKLSVSPRINANIGFSVRDREEETLDENKDLRNASFTNEMEDLSSADFSNRIDFIKRFGAEGSYLQIDLDHSHRRQENDNFYFSESIFIADGGEQNEIQDQYIDQDEKENSFGVGFSKRSVLADKLFFDLNYRFSTSSSRNTRNVFDAVDGEYSSFNELLSNDFKVNNYKHTPNAGINYEGEKWRVNTEIGLLSTTLKTDNYIEAISFDNTFNNIFVDADVRYSLERSKSVSVGYSTSADVPSVRQLQPVIDRTNPLNIIVGNPSLEPTFNQRLSLNFRNFDFATRSGFFTYLYFNFTDNQIAATSSVDDNFVRRTTYTNVDGVINGNLGGSYSKSFKKDERELRMRLRMNAGYNHNVGFINAVEYNSDQWTLSPGFQLTYAIDELFEINPGYGLTYNDIKYDINSGRDQSYVNHSLSLEATTYWPKNVVFGNDISYNEYGNVAPGFDNTSLLWNMSLGYQFLKEKATLKFKIYDLLDQNVDTRRLVGDDYIQDVNNLILRRYGMLSFTYKFSSFGGAESKGRRGGNRIIRM